MPGKKKKSSYAKKKKSINPRATHAPPDVETVLARADEAANATDLQTALSLYTYASNQIRERIEGSNGQAPAASTAASGGDGGNAGNIRDDVLLLSKTLGKCGEARVSLGDQEGGRQAFLDAISLLKDGFGDDSMDEDHSPSVDAAGEGVSDAQLLEAMAGLHLYLGQLSEAEEALSHCKSGVTALRRCVDILENILSADVRGAAVPDRTEEDTSREALQNARLDTKSQLCGAYCSIAELYLTDLCYDPEAENQCEVSLRAALDLDDAGGTPDALQGMANLRLSQGRVAEATCHVLEAYSRMKVGCEAMADLVGLGKDNAEETKDSSANIEEKAKELVEVDAAHSLPGFEFRCQTAKLLLECSAKLSGSSGKMEDNDHLSKEREQGSFCAEAAVQVLGSLLAENDEVVEVWYLLGCAFASSTPSNDDASRYYWERALEMLKKVKESLDQEIAAVPEALGDGEELQCQIQDIGSQIEDVKEKLEGLDKNGGSNSASAYVNMETS